MGCLPLRTNNLWIENLKLFSSGAGFPDVFIFSAEPKKPEQDLKALKSAGTSNTSEKALEQGRGWESQCPLLQKASYFIPSSLECPQVFMRSSLTLVTNTAFPASTPQPLSLQSDTTIWVPATAAWRARDNSEQRGQPHSLTSACALGEFKCHKFQKPTLHLSAVSSAGHVPCKPCEDPVREVGTLPVGALGTASPWELLSCVPGSSRNPANKCQGNIFTLLLLCCFLGPGFSAVLLDGSFLAPCSLGYRELTCPLLASAAPHPMGRITVPSVFLFLARQCGAGHCSAQREPFTLIFWLSCFVFLLSSLSALSH